MTGREENPRDYDAEDPPRFGEWVRLRKLDAALISKPPLQVSPARRASVPRAPSPTLFRVDVPTQPRPLFQRFAPMLLVVPALMGFIVLIGIITYRGNRHQILKTSPSQEASNTVSVPQGNRIEKVELLSPDTEGGMQTTLLVHVRGVVEENAKSIKVQLKRPIDSSPLSDLPSPKITTKSEGKDKVVVTYNFQTEPVMQTELVKIFVSTQGMERPLEAMLTVRPVEKQGDSVLIVPADATAASNKDKIAHLKAEIKQAEEDRRKYLEQFNFAKTHSVEPAKQELDQAAEKVKQILAGKGSPANVNARELEEAQKSQYEAEQKYNQAKSDADAVHAKAEVAFEAGKKANRRIAELGQTRKSLPSPDR